MNKKILRLLPIIFIIPSFLIIIGTASAENIPQIQIISPLNSSYSTTNINLNWSSGTFNWSGYSLNGAANVTLLTQLTEDQDMENASSCGSNWEPFHPGSSTNDELWNTYGIAKDSTQASCYVNYTKRDPSYYYFLTAKEIILAGAAPWCAFYSSEITIPTNCTASNTIEIVYVSNGEYHAGGYGTHGQCNIDGVQPWYTLWSCGTTGSFNAARFYEEKIRWTYGILGSPANDSFVAIQGTNTVVVWASNENGTFNSSAVSFFVDTVSPDITINAPANTTFDYNAVNFNFTFSEEADTAKYSTDDGTNTTNTTLNVTWFGSFGGLATGIHNVTVWVNDTYGNSNTSVAYFTVKPEPPYWNENKSSLPSTYNTSNCAYFNVSWNDTLSSVSVVLIETNISGTAKNFTMTNSFGGTIYNFTYTSPDAGDHYLRFYSNDTYGNLNVSDTFRFTISRASQTPDIYINDSKNTDKSIYQTQSWNISGITTDTAINITIHVNSIISGSGMGYASNISTGAIGSYNVTMISLSNSNYTSVSRTQTVTIVTIGTPTYSDIKTEYTSPETFNYLATEREFNITWSWNSSLSNLSEVWIDFNGTNYTATLNRSISAGDAEFYTTLGSYRAGTYSYRWYANNFAGNTGSTTSQNYVINKASPSSGMSLASSSGWTFYSGTGTTVTGSESNGADGSCTYQLKMNDVLKSNPYTLVYSTGIYSFNYSTAGCQNYTDGYVTQDLSVLSTPSGSTGPTGGTGEEQIVYVSTGNWSIVHPDFFLLMSPGDSLKEYITIDNRLAKEISEVSVKCISPACANDGCVDLCKYVTFGKLSYVAGTPGIIPSGQQGKIDFVIDLRNEYRTAKNLPDVPSGTYSFSITVEIEKNTVPVSVSVTVLPGMRVVNQGLEWMTGSTVLLPGLQLTAPNWMIAVVMIVTVIIGIAVFMTWIVKKPKKNVRYYLT